MAPTISESRDLTEFVAKQGNGVKGLAEIGLKSVPKQYIQPLEERMDMQNVVTQESIPVIDMSKWDDPHVMRSIKKFFGLPAEEKMMYTKENSLTNNVRYGTSFVPEAEESLEWKDYLSLFYTSEEEAYAFSISLLFMSSSSMSYTYCLCSQQRYGNCQNGYSFIYRHDTVIPQDPNSNFEYDTT